MPLESSSSTLPSDEDYENFAKKGYVQDFKTGIDENIWSSNILNSESPNREEEEVK